MVQTVAFPGRYDSLAKISEFVVQAAKEAGFDEKAVYEVDLAVDEACTNIIEHAYGGEGLGEIRCTCIPLSNGLKIILQDYGRSFNPAKVPAPTTKTRLKDVKSRGAGLFIMRRMMDEVHFEFTVESGNILTMVKYRGKKKKSTRKQGKTGKTEAK